MKKLTAFLITIVLSNIAVADNFFYCPDKVECYKKGDINSCRATGGNIISFLQNLTAVGTIEQGIYEFSKGQAIDSQYSYDGHYKVTHSISCHYKNVNQKITRILEFKMTTPKFDAYADNKNGWIVEGWDAFCNAEASICPFILSKENA